MKEKVMVFFKGRKRALLFSKPAVKELDMFSQYFLLIVGANLYSFFEGGILFN